MNRDLTLLTGTRFDVLILGGGIHGLAAAYDAAQRGLRTALIERGDFGGGSSFNHARTVHGGLRSLQTGDVPKARFSMHERRALARIAPNYVEPLAFMMGTTTKIMRSRLALRAAFAIDATVGYDRNAGVVPWLHLPAGRVDGAAAYREAFGANASPGITGAARWNDYHMAESDRLTLAFAHAAVGHGAVLANYVEAIEPRRVGATVVGVTAVDRETGAGLDIDARLVVNATGGHCARWMAALGGRPGFPLIKATNVVTSRPAGPVAMGAPTSGGRLLLVMPWKGRALFGTSHSETPVEAHDSGVSPAELGLFLDEINSAFPAFGLTAADVTLVHRGVVPAERHGSGTLGLMAHHRIHDHAADGVRGAMTVVGVKYTTGRGVAEQVVDRACELLGEPSRPCRTGETLLPGAFAHPADREIEEAVLAARGLGLAEAAPGLVRTHGTAWRAVVDACADSPALCEPLAPGVPVPRAVLAHAVRHEMARTLTDVVVRRTGLGAAGYPGDEVAAGCASWLATHWGWSDDRRARELADLRAFYAPVAPPDPAPGPR
jgi:glycerol-3-phosphate dehydrogenase